MKTLYRLCIKLPFKLEEAWHLLEAAEIEILYGSEEKKQIELYVHLFSPQDLSEFDWITECTPYTLPPIDWEAQWAAHGQNYQEGYVHVDFTPFGKNLPPLRLQPGSGFGDLSHPTTRLMLGLLAKHIKKQVVIDIGCGSGVLALAAIALGASYVHGIDIEPEAIEHSYQNACLNQMDQKCAFDLPSDFKWQISPTFVLILMNMIQSEQQVAWSSLPHLHPQKAIYLTSGVRVEERESYLNLTSQWGWELQEQVEEEGWLAFYFINKIFIEKDE